MLNFDAFEVSSKEEDDLSTCVIWLLPEQVLAWVVDKRNIMS